MIAIINGHAHVAESADALDLGSSAARRAGSTPVMRTITKRNPGNRIFSFVESVVYLRNRILIIAAVKRQIKFIDDPGIRIADTHT